jgi:hypothetical protein
MVELNAIGTTLVLVTHDADLASALAAPFAWRRPDVGSRRDDHAGLSFDAWRETGPKRAPGAAAWAVAIGWPRSSRSIHLPPTCRNQFAPGSGVAGRRPRVFQRRRSPRGSSRNRFSARGATGATHEFPAMAYVARTSGSRWCKRRR